MAKTRQEPTAPPAFVGPYELAMLAAQAPPIPHEWASRSTTRVMLPMPAGDEYRAIPGYLWNQLMQTCDMSLIAGLELTDDERVQIHQIVIGQSERVKQYWAAWEADLMAAENQWRVTWARDLLARCSENER